MTVTALVLGAVVLSMIGIIAAYISQRRVPALDERSIDNAAQLDAALAIQRSIRIAELQRRVTEENYWSFALLGVAFVMQITALALDHLTHPAIAAISILPSFFLVLTIRGSRRKYAQRQLDTYLRNESSSRVT
jgi:hypothetical protein